MSREFVDYLSEVFTELGDIRVRRMFGGYGLYHRGLMFALVAEDTLYLKADAQNAGEFHERELPAFEYLKAGKVVKISYFQAPEEILEDPVEAAHWARLSVAAALRAKKA